MASLFRLIHAALVLLGPVMAFRAGRPDAGARLARVLAKLGPAYIKLGQMLATRPDIVGAAVATALEHLQDRLPPFPEAQARAVIAQSLGRPLTVLFAELGPAVAAASIAQVHRARTSEGADVAVKVLRPGIEARFARDLAALDLFARPGRSVSAEARRLRFIAIKETLAASVALEWICAWKRRRHPNSMSAQKPMPISASPMWTGAAPPPVS